MTRTPFARAAHPTAHDLKLWGQLVDKALAAGRKPDGDGQALRKAAERAFKARMPVGQQTRASACVHLVTVAREWWRRPPEDRAAFADDLIDVAEMVASILADPAGAAAGRRVLPPADR